MSQVETKEHKEMNASALKKFLYNNIQNVDDIISFMDSLEQKKQRKLFNIVNEKMLF